jgi:hypothetical protein
MAPQPAAAFLLVAHGHGPEEEVRRLWRQIARGIVVFDREAEVYRLA